jgi:hypothetical protein
MLHKSKYKLSFHRFYIFLDFTLILNGPLRKLKSAFLGVNLPVVWKVGVDRVIKFQNTTILRDQASYAVDNKTGSNGKVVPFHEMKTSSGE